MKVQLCAMQHLIRNTRPTSLVLEEVVAYEAYPSAETQAAEVVTISDGVESDIVGVGGLEIAGVPGSTRVTITLDSVQVFRQDATDSIELLSNDLTHVITFGSSEDAAAAALAIIAWLG